MAMTHALINFQSSFGGLGGTAGFGGKGMVKKSVIVFVIE